MKKEKNLNINEQIPSFERTLWNDTEDVQTKKEKKIKVKKMNKVKSLKQNVLDEINFGLIEAEEIDFISYLKSLGIGGNNEKKKKLYSDYYSEKL